MWRAGVDNAESSAAAYTRSCGPWPTNISVSAFRHRRCNKTRLRNRAPPGAIRQRKIASVPGSSNASAPIKRSSGIGSNRGVQRTWPRFLQRRAEYEAWTDPRPVLDASRTSPAQLLAQAPDYARHDSAQDG